MICFVPFIVLECFGMLFLSSFHCFGMFWNDMFCSFHCFGMFWNEIFCSFHCFGMFWNHMFCSFHCLGMFWNDMFCSFHCFGMFWNDMFCSFHCLGIFWNDMFCSFHCFGMFRYDMFCSFHCFGMFWSDIFCLCCLIMFPYHFSVTSFANSFRFISSRFIVCFNCCVAFLILPLHVPMCFSSILTFLLVVVDFSSVFPVSFPIQVMNFFSWSLGRHRLILVTE